MSIVQISSSTWRSWTGRARTISAWATSLEAHAYLVEKKSHWVDLDSLGYLHMLNEGAPGPEYRHAYDLARFRLGDSVAFAYFPLIASLALCAADPSLAFDILITEVARSSLPPTPGASDYPTVQKLATDTVPNLVGTSAEVYERTGLTHPIYTAALKAINDASYQGFSVLDFFADPANRLESIVTDGVRPMVFRANAEDQFPIFVPPKLSQGLVLAQVLYSVLASRVLGPQAYEASQRSEADGYDWLALVPPDLLDFPIEPTQLYSGELGVFDHLKPGEHPGGLA